MKQIIALALLFSFLFSDTQAQVKADDYSARFFAALNSYNGALLENMQGFDFAFRNTAVPAQDISSEKAFAAYCANARLYRKQYIIKKVIDAAKRSFLIEEQGAYPRALGVAYPEFIFTLTLDEQGQLGALDIDTTKNYPVYRRQLHEKSKRFESWRKKKMLQPGGLEQYGDAYPERLNSILEAYEKER